MPLHCQNSWRREKLGNVHFSILKRRPPSAVLLRRTGKRRAPLHSPGNPSTSGLACRPRGHALRQCKHLVAVLAVLRERESGSIFSSSTPPFHANNLSLG